jgi:prepilin-type N-terminal cleavage/methylation domain-containing protein
MNKKRAFTLIELLVVIAIIALLMSILMPALAKAKKQALKVADLAAKHQMAIVTAQYTNENDGYFPARVVGANYYWLWMYTLKPYYKDPQMRFCPAAKNAKKVTGPFGTWNYGLGSYRPLPNYPMRARGSAGPIDESEYNTETGRVDQGHFTGSIALNRFIEDMKGSFEGDPAFWRKADIKGADNVPVFVDSMYCYFSVYTPAAEPPDYDGAFDQNELQWCCINRHMGYMGVVFADWSAKMVGLKELWTLKFSRTYDTCGPWTVCNTGKPATGWPQWMRGFKDY